MYQEELKKCIGCKKPKCSEGCPAKTPIYEIFNLLKEGKEAQAGQLFFENNPMSYICSIVCDHAKQCYGNCIMNAKGKPVKVYEIEQEVSKKYLDSISFNATIDNSKKVAVVGSGPAGITASIKLAQAGYKVVLFEAFDHIGGILRYGIPQFRLNKEILNDYLLILKQLQVDIRYNVIVGQTLTIEMLKADGYKAILLTTGLWKPSSLDLIGEGHAKTYYAIDYLKNAKDINLGKKVVVIGAGNVAIDAARSAKFYGSEEVYIYYRGGFDRMKASLKEIEEAKEEGIIFETYARPISITDAGFAYRKTIQTEDKKLADLDEIDRIFDCNSVVIATGQSTRYDFSTTNLTLNKWDLLEVDENYMTNIDSVFASGDIVSGAKTVVDAMDMTKKVVDSIIHYIK